MIEGVTIRELVTHGDERGFFREILRATDPAFQAGFGQWSHSLVRQDVLKAWHAHVNQYQWTYMASGLFEVVLYDHRPESPTFRAHEKLLLGDQQPARVYGFPPGVLHGYRCLAAGHVLYMTSGTYDLADEVRIAPDDPSIAYSW